MTRDEMEATRSWEVNDVTDAVSRTELLLPGPAEALAGLLDVAPTDLESDGLPLLWHWIYLLDHPRQEDLGDDGHPIRHVIPAPPEAGRRRMWAGGRVRTLRPLMVGREATKTTRILSTTEKQGRTGRLTFVVVEHAVEQGGLVSVVEQQDIVYRDATNAAATEMTKSPDEAVALQPGDWEIPVSPTLLFRFSALTYNGHRIHYDRDYAHEVEGYDGLVTHGPLQAIAMAEAARADGAGGPLSIDYRLVAPLREHQGLVARADHDGGKWSTVVRDVFGRPTARGIVKREPGGEGHG